MLIDREVTRKALKGIAISRSIYGRRGSKRSLRDALRLASIARAIVEEFIERNIYVVDREGKLCKIDVSRLAIER